jgi:hypothetical protein
MKNLECKKSFPLYIGTTYIGVCPLHIKLCT